LDVKLFGPVQAYELAPEGKEVKLYVCPAQIAELLDAVGAEGIGFTVTLMAPAALVQPAPEVAVTK
jgi:hypothetical protein